MILVIALILSSLASAVGAVPQADQDRRADAIERAEQARNELLHTLSYEEQVKENAERFNLDSTELDKTYAPDEKVRVIIKLNEHSVVEELNHKGISLESMSANEVSAKQEKIEKNQEALMNQLKTQRVDFEAKHQFQHVINAVSGEVTFGEIERIKKLAGVEEVWISQEYYPDTTAKPDMYFSAPLIGSEEVWNSEFKGKGMIVSVIDSGVNYHHPAFGGTGKETMKLGGDINYSPVTGNGQGYGGTRVIGGWNHADGNNDIIDRTSSQHGVHVAGTVGGDDPSSVTDGKTFRGVAPEVSILAEKVFSNDPARGSTLTDEIIAAIEHSVENGAHVINMSLGSPAGAFTPDHPQIIAIENATKQGVVFSVSAGNSGFSTPTKPFASNQDYAMVGSPSISSSTISVAASVNAAAIFEGIVLSEAISSPKEGITNLKEMPIMVASGLPHTGTLAGQTLEFVYVA